MAVFAVFAVVVGNVDLPRVEPWFLLPAIYLCIAFHEVGHLLAGIWRGFDVRSCTVGGLSLTRFAGHWRLKLHWRRLLDGGSAGVLPLQGTRQLRDYAWMLAGGPLASVALAAVLLPFISLHAPHGTSVNTLLLASLIILLSCLPYGVSAPTDGTLLLMLWRDPGAANAWIALFELCAADARGVEPRDWDPRLCRRVERISSRSPSAISARLMEYVRQLDLDAIDDAASGLEDALAISGRTNDRVRAILFWEACGFQAHCRGNAAAAREWAERAGRFADCDKYVMLWGQARLLAAERRYEDAHAMSVQWRAEFARTGVCSGLASLCRRHAAEFEADCLARAALSAQAG